MSQASAPIDPDSKMVWIRSTDCGNGLSTYHDDDDCHLASGGRWIPMERAEKRGLTQCVACAGKEFRHSGAPGGQWSADRLEGLRRLMDWAYAEGGA